MSDETDKWYLSGSLAIRAKGTSEELISFEEPNGNTKWHINQNLSGNKPGLNFVETGVADGRLFIGAGGNVGMGTADPKYLLHLKSDRSILALDSNTAGQASEFRFLENGEIKWRLGNAAQYSKFVLSRGALDVSLAIDQDGRVGIGTTNPTHPLHVKTNWGFLALDSNAAGQDSGLRLMEGGAVKWHLFNSAKDSKFYLIRDGLNASLTIDQNGLVGIGTTNPTHPLHVKTNWGFLALDSNAAGQDSGLRLMEGGAVKWHLFNSARDSKFYLIRDGLNASLIIDQGGNIDIGANPIRFSSGWTASPDGVGNRAEISNDTGGFKTLMIVGNNSAGVERRVSVWDRLEVNGTFAIIKPINDDEGRRILQSLPTNSVIFGIETVHGSGHQGDLMFYWKTEDGKMYRNWLDSSHEI